MADRHDDLTVEQTKRGMERILMRQGKSRAQARAVIRTVAAPKAAPVSAEPASDDLVTGLQRLAAVLRR